MWQAFDGFFMRLFPYELQWLGFGLEILAEILAFLGAMALAAGLFERTLRKREQV